MPLRRSLAALALGLLAAGCGQSVSQRQAVATYLKQINKVESALVSPLRTVTNTGAQFAQEQRTGGTLTGLVTASHEQALLRAGSQIGSLGNRLASVRPPAAARHLRSLLLQIIDGQAGLTRELAQLVVFLPRYQASLTPLVPATRRLEAALTQQTANGTAAVAAVYASKAAALRRFRGVVDGVLSRLRHLRPPAVQVPDYTDQVRSFEGMSSAAGRLATALQAGPQGNVRQLLEAFDRAATLTQTAAAQKARIAAIRAYDGESNRLSKLSQDAELERQRLANNLR